MNLTINDLSYWEKNLLFESVDFLVVGAGIVGLSSAYHLKVKHPKANILVVDKGILPLAASSKNAGFACFGSPSEILSDLRTTDSSKVWQTVQKRWNGLQALHDWLGKDLIDLQINGSWDLTQTKHKSHEIRDQLSFLNEELKNITGVSDVYSEDKNGIENFGFNNLDSLFKNKLEGQLDVSKLNQTLIKKIAEKDIQILRGIEYISYSSGANSVKIETSIGTITSQNLILCTNGFTNTLLPDLKIESARAQVLITKPIENLKIKGTFHFDEGYFYFRNYENRILIGGGRNHNFEKENTCDIETTEEIQLAIENVLKTIVMPNTSFEIEHRWAGIMGVGLDKSPIIKRLNNRVCVGVRMGGMGIAIGTLVGQDLAELHS